MTCRKGKVDPMLSAVLCEENETVVFSRIIRPSKEVRERGVAAVMRELRM